MATLFGSDLVSTTPVFKFMEWSMHMEPEYPHPLGFSKPSLGDVKFSPSGKKSMQIGKTDLGPAEVRVVMEEISGVYLYHLITKNCNHFCHDACVRLTGNPIPSWINRLTRIGFFCNCVLPASLCSTKVQLHKMEEKVLIEEERTLLMDGVMCATKNSSPSPPSDSQQGRSRSRGRRAQAQTPSPSATILDS